MSTFQTVKQRILHIIDTLDRTGTTRQLMLLACGLPRDRFETHVCALGHDGPIAEELAQAGVPGSLIGRRWPADPLTFWQLVRQIRQLRPDAIVAWQPAGRAYAAAAVRRCGIGRLVAVWRTAETNRGPWQATIDRLIGRQASAVVATCPAVRDYCLAQGIPADKIQVVRSGVKRASEAALTRGQLLDRLGLPANARLIGWAARLERDRGGKDAIWAADLLKVIRDDAHLLIFGDGPYRGRLVRFRNQVAIADKVHFLGDCGDMAQFLPLIDQFWSTGRRTGQPQAALEAMAAGVPVIAADASGMRDLIEHEATGYLFAPGHRAGIARWAEFLINHPETARRIGAAGREKVEQRHDAEKILKEWDAVIS